MQCEHIEVTFALVTILYVAKAVVTVCLLTKKLLRVTSPTVASAPDTAVIATAAAAGTSQKKIDLTLILYIGTYIKQSLLRKLKLANQLVCLWSPLVNLPNLTN